VVRYGASESRFVQRAEHIRPLSLAGRASVNELRNVTKLTSYH
jgi:hypothetical protein